MSKYSWLGALVFLLPGVGLAGSAAARDAYIAQICTAHIEYISGMLVNGEGKAAVSESFERWKAEHDAQGRPPEDAYVAMVRDMIASAGPDGWETPAFSACVTAMANVKDL